MDEKRGDQIARAAVANGEGVATPRGNGSAAGALPVRWIALFTGTKATEDYEPASSQGESPALVKEVTQICVAFHPHTEIRLFPGEAMLFWRAAATGDWVVTDIALAPNPKGVRTSLEYCSVVMNEETFRVLLGRNPFHIHDLKLRDKVRQQFLDSRFTPIMVEVPVGGNSNVAAAGPGNAVAGSRSNDIIPGLSEDLLATPENVRALEAFCARQAEAGRNAPPLATWWSSGGAPPPDVFKIVLRAQKSPVMTLRDAVDATTALANDVKAALPNASGNDAVVVELTRSILTHVDVAQSAAAGAAGRLNSETPDQFRERLTEGAHGATQAAADIHSLIRRLGPTLPPTVVTTLNEIADRCEEIGREMPKVRHPNPFANRRVAPQAERSESDKRTASAPNGNVRYIIPAAAAIVLIGGGMIFLNRQSNQSAKPPDNPNPTPIVAPSTVAPPSAAPAVDQTYAPLVAHQDEVADAAKQSAHNDARVAAGKTTETLSDTQVDKMVLTALENAYKKAIPPDKYAAVFPADQDATTTYSQIEKALPALVASVHEEAMLGAVEGHDSRQINAIKTSADEEKAKAEEAAQEAKIKADAEAAKAAAALAASTARNTSHQASRSSSGDEAAPKPTHHRHADTTEPTHSAAPAHHAAPAPTAAPVNNAGSAGANGL